MLFPRIAALAFLLSPVASQALTWGVVGDSLSDEYRDTQLYGNSWVELLAAEKGEDFGAFEPDKSVRGEPRRSGYARNWARYGAYSGAVYIATIGPVNQPASLDGRNQVSGLAAQIVAAGGIDLAVIRIGGQDLSLFDQFGGSLDPDDPDFIAEKNLLVANVLDAVDALHAAGAAHVLVAYPIPTFFRAPEDLLAIDAIHAELATGVTQHGAAIVELEAAIRARFDLNTNVVVRNVAMALDSVASTDQLVDLPPGVPPDGFEPGPCYEMGDHFRCATPAYHQNVTMSDGGHPSTIIQALIANALAETANAAFGLAIPTFGDDEILDLVGLPEPSIPLEAISAIAGLAILRRRPLFVRRRG